jgi:hypothetical protein
MRNSSISFLLPVATLFAAASVSFAQAPQSQSSSSTITDQSWVAPSTELDQTLPYWLKFGGEEQIRAEGIVGAGFKLHDANDGYMLNRIRFDMKLLPLSWLKFDFQAQDAQAFWKNQKPYAPPYQDTWDLSRANVTIGNLETYHVQAQIGRQLMMFGDGRLIGNLEWLNSARAYDAARVDSSYGKYRLSAFAASVVLQQDGQVGYHNLGSYVEGFYGGLDNVIPESTIEPYFFWRRNPGQKMEDGKLGNEHFGVPGVRWVGKLPYGFDYGTEVAVERGSIATDTLSAWASHVALGYAIPPVRTFASHFTTEYNFASGGYNVKTGEHNTFDTIYASSHDKYDFTDEIGWKNIKNLRQTLSTNLTPKLGVAVKYGDYWLDNSRDALYTISSVVVSQSKNGTAGTWVGQELDGVLTYSFPNRSKIITGFGYLMPGTFLKETTPGHTYSYPFLGYSTSF